MPEQYDLLPHAAFLPEPTVADPGRHAAVHFGIDYPSVAWEAHIDMAENRTDGFVAPTEVTYGRGAVANVAGIVARYSPDRLLVVSDPGVIAAGLLDRVTDQLEVGGPRWQTFSDIEANPSVETVERAFAAYRAAGAEAILVVGGGSAMDVAKAVGILATNGGKITDYEGGDRVGRPAAPIIGVPTTAGTASEVTIFCVITDRARKFKFSCRSANLAMRQAIMDPELTVSMPPALTAAVGMDTLTHAIESYVSALAYPLTEALSLSAIALVHEHLERAVHDGGNIEARDGMLMACWMAGLAFTQARLGNVHAMSHPVGGHFNVPHGVANAIILPVVMDYNAPFAAAKFARIAESLGHRLSGNDGQDAAAAVQLVRRLSERVGIPPSLGAVHVPRDGIPALAADAMQSGNIAINPRPTTYEDMVRLYTQCF
jgi:alcohol dehydrogenase